MSPVETLTLNELEKTTFAGLQSAAAAQGVSVKWREVANSLPVPFDKELIAAVSDAAEERSMIPAAPFWVVYITVLAAVDDEHRRHRLLFLAPRARLKGKSEKTKIGFFKNSALRVKEEVGV